ncbi:MAG: hypothetical protein H6Q31_192 [Bacteroidetes bacterium]|nr:hypothetical protein [Bacteroidota bacterium]
MPGRKLLSLLHLVLFVSVGGFGQGNTVRIIFEANPGRTSVIGIFQSNGIAYASLTDIAEVCSLPLSHDLAARRAVLGTPDRYLILSDRAAVAVAIVAGNGSTDHRLSASVISVNDNFFVPLESLLPVLRSAFGIVGVYDAENLTLRLGITAILDSNTPPNQHQPRGPKAASIRPTPATASATTPPWIPRLFVDCKNGCDEDFLKTELTFVHYVRDKELADVHMLVTTKAAGNGGKEYSLNFVGYKGFSGLVDTLRFYTLASDTDELIRQKLTTTAKLGLTRYLARTPLGLHARIDFPDWNAPAAPRVDPWDSWVFNTDISAELQGEKSSKDMKFGGSVSGSRVTQLLKIRLGYSMSYAENRFDFSGSTILSVARSEKLSSLFAIGLGEHWSVGLFGELSSSTYDNSKLWAHVAPAVEFDLFPYSEHSRRQFPLTYRLGYIFASYLEETIYDRTNESLYLHSLSIGLDLKELWGTIHIQAEVSQYLHDLTKHRIEFESKLSIRLWEGFSLWTAGTVSIVHDQLGLPKSGATPDQVLLHRKELETSYYYYGGIGISFTFGSIYSNIVNPRFGD